MGNLYGFWVLYYSVSTVGSQNSAIGLATSNTLEPGDWLDWGAVVTSKAGDSYNASTYLSVLFDLAFCRRSRLHEVVTDANLRPQSTLA